MKKHLKLKKLTIIKEKLNLKLTRVKLREETKLQSSSSSPEPPVPISRRSLGTREV